MLNEVEMTKNLLENRKKDFQIRSENFKAQSFSYFKKFEISIDEFIEFA